MDATHDYAFLLLPSHNRVYAQESARLARAELLVLNETVLGGRIEEIEERTLGGVRYLTFRAPRLGGDDLAQLANLSGLYALFERTGETLTPLPVERLDAFPDDLITIQKYVGKTNEDFTKLLLNVTAFSCARPERLLTRRLRVLDPLAGRGTTLNQAVMYGLDAAGVERDTKSFDAYQNFFRQWLRNSRIKHRADLGPVRRHHRTIGRRLAVTLGVDKERYRAGETIDVTAVNADTTAAGDFFPAGSFDLIVTDAPYGVQHGSRSRDAGGPTRSRSPLPLLAEALPVWHRLLRPGGAIGISWNTLVARRAELTALLAEAGLDVRESEPYLGFAHRVDQAITRDLVVAVRPTATGDTGDTAD
ncbi:SAM-dependent methyltransferase [Streptomyces sp. 3MP-14]|uniref:SAM-dependent methyltransferase n=1 Tax=Streptomyces mimosae TaxID=2586635 RepID=A0A5N6A2Q4_9ACTN|nr:MULTISPECIES: SAM-dependent methyltransferase [Streptomyces]KAB8161618.1 SAM-dependent methyltransferase [Streptomyces mimosae]KAB8173445.1 SAM-dependent methyltransferase [Streptomyces sp. 3MP-14]